MWKTQNNLSWKWIIVQFVTNNIIIRKFYKICRFLNHIGTSFYPALLQVFLVLPSASSYWYLLPIVNYEYCSFPSNPRTLLYHRLHNWLSLLLCIGWFLWYAKCVSLAGYGSSFLLWCPTFWSFCPNQRWTMSCYLEAGKLSIWSQGDQLTFLNMQNCISWLNSILLSYGLNFLKPTCFPWMYTISKEHHSCVH